MPADPVSSQAFELIRSVAAGFGIHVQGAGQCRGVWCLETDAGKKYLKRSRFGPPDLRFIHEFLLYLHQNGFRQTPLLTVNQRGEPFVRHESEYFIMSDWYLGQELDFNRTEDLRDAARFLAEFHLHGAGFAPSAYQPERTVWLGWITKLEQRIGQLNEFYHLALMEKEDSLFSQLYLRHFDFYYRQAIATYQRFVRSPYPVVAYRAARDRQICHHDVSGRNILRLDDQRLMMVDFVYCLRDIRLHDLLNLMIRNLIHNHWHPRFYALILGEYQVIAPLTKEEQEVLRILLAWPHDFWQVGLQYYIEKLPWPSGRFLRKLKRKTADRFARERFLHEISAKNDGFAVLRPSL